MIRIAFVLAMIVIRLHAQTIAPGGNDPIIKVHGEATISAQPDQAQLDIGVVTQAVSTSTAVAQNAAQTTAVMRELKGFAADKDIKTINFSLTPNFKYPKDGGSPTVNGYTANNTVLVSLHDLSKVPELIEVSTKWGANTLGGLRYTLEDQKTVRTQALAAAAKQAQLDAEALASAMHLSLGRLLRIEEGQVGTNLPVRAVLVSAARAEKTPISPGSIDIHAEVDLTYEILNSPSAPTRPH